MSDKESEMSQGRDDLGIVREKELLSALRLRFGTDCVYYSPKTGSAKTPKELCDIIVLALPYAIVIQLKWLKSTAEDFVEGEESAVKRERLLRRMHKAAEQYKELSSALSHDAIITLSRVWSANGNRTFQLPLQRIKKIVPLVIVDFQDQNYLDPEKRYTDIPPVITDVPTQIKGWGLVHSFLLADFFCVIDQLFTVGDLLLWLRERERFFTERPKMLLGYNELTLFSLYLVNNPLWRKIVEGAYNGVWIDDNDCFERVLCEKGTAFQKRRDMFHRKNVVDELIMRMANVADCEVCVQKEVSPMILDYLEYSGRIKCWPSMIKHDVARKLIEHLSNFQPTGRSLPILGSYGFFDYRPVSETVYYFGVAEFNEENAEIYCRELFIRALSYIQQRGMKGEVSELFILLTRKDRPSVCCKVCPITDTDYQYAISEAQLKQTRLSFSTEEFCLSEWDIVK